MGCAGAKVEMTESHSLNFSDSSRVAHCTASLTQIQASTLLKMQRGALHRTELGMLTCLAREVALKLFTPDLGASLRDSQDVPSLRAESGSSLS